MCRRCGLPLRKIWLETVRLTAGPKGPYNTHMNTTTQPKKKTVYFGGEWFTTPFYSNGYWVEDATGKNVAEARDRELAKALADLLNTKA